MNNPFLGVPRDQKMTQAECDSLYEYMLKHHPIKITGRIPVDDTHTKLVFEDGIEVVVYNKKAVNRTAERALLAPSLRNS